MSSSHQLAAIVFTDIVGYTALMGNDEQKAFTILKKNRELQKPIIEQFNGRWIKELGDGVLASFHSVSDAVAAAIKIQDACHAAKDFQLRIGIHLGEVVFEENDVFGDGVNIAARIQAAAPAGGILISEAVQKLIANKNDLQTKFVREETMKNVKETVRLYEVITNSITESGPSFQTDKSTSQAILEKSIAVLSFVNMSNDPAQEYFGDGMAEEILNSLSHLKDLKVAGRSSSFFFKGKNADLHEIGEKLKVSKVLEGSIRKQGNRIRITAQLINVKDGFHLWSEKYDRNMDDIFAIQDEIALAITEQLKITLLEKDREKIIKTTTQNAEAYELYLKGRFYLNRRGSSIITGLQCFKEAIAVDPDYALAYFGVGAADVLIAFYSFLPGKEVMKDVKEAVETSIRLDNYLGESYQLLGAYNVYMEWNWEEGKKNHRKAIELNPKYAQGYSLYGLNCLLWVEGKFEEAAEQCRIAIKLEPLSAIDHADLAWVLYTAYRFDEGLTFAKKGIELDGNSFLSHRIAGLCNLGLKRYEEAIEKLKYCMKISNRNQHAVNSLIWAYCSNGNFEQARELMNELEKRSVTEYIAGTHLALSAAYLRDIDATFQYLEKAYNDRDPMLLILKYSPDVPSWLRSDPRFDSFLNRIGFPK